MKATRISMTGVAASTGGSILTAAVVLLSSGLALANPPSTATAPYGSPAPGPGASAMDLPMAPPVLGGGTPASDPADDEPQADEQTGDDPRDTPPPVFFGETIEDSTDSMIFVVDLSGSMSIMASGSFEDENGQIVTGNRLDRAKAELKKSIQGLPENFFFNVMFFDECVASCWNDKQEATVANKSNAFAWIDALQPDGWSNTGLAVQTALTDQENRSIVLLSDGSPNFLDCAMNYVGSFDDHANLIRAANTQGATIDAFGIGISGDPSARSFMQRVASENGGSYTEVD